VRARVLRGRRGVVRMRVVAVTVVVPSYSRTLYKYASFQQVVKSARAAQLDQPHTSRFKAVLAQPHGQILKGHVVQWTFRGVCRAGVSEKAAVGRQEKVAVDTETLSQKLKDPVAGQSQHPVVVHQACDI
jgi:hypothetical protein